MQLIITSIIAVLAPLIGEAFMASIQLRTQRNKQQFQYMHARLKKEDAQVEKERIFSLQRLEIAHNLLTYLGREFSYTNLHILWCAKIKESEYDQRYLAACKEVDALRAFADLHEPSLSDKIEHIYGTMNIAWGVFKKLLYLSTKEKNIQNERDIAECLVEMHISMGDIDSKIFIIKNRLADLASNYKKISRHSLVDL